MSESDYTNADLHPRRPDRFRHRAAPCCDLHGRNCEPPSELCCRDCNEARHPGHTDGSACSNPDLSANVEREFQMSHSPKPAPGDRNDLANAVSELRVERDALQQELQSWRTVAHQMNEKMLELQDLADLYAKAETLDGKRVASAIHATIASRRARGDDGARATRPLVGPFPLGASVASMLTPSARPDPGFTPENG